MVKCFSSPLTANIYLPAIPTIAASFDKSIELINLTVTVYMILQGVCKLQRPSELQYFLVIFSSNALGFVSRSPGTAADLSCMFAGAEHGLHRSCISSNFGLLVTDVAPLHPSHWVREHDRTWYI